MGDTDDSAHPTPTQVGSADDWAAVSCGGGHTLALKKDGTLWAWGDNHYGQLGLGDTTTGTRPTEVGSASDWAAVSCGGRPHPGPQEGRHPLGLGRQRRTASSAWAIPPSRHTPTEVGSASDWAAVSAGGYAHPGPQEGRHPLGLGLQRRRPARPGRYHRQAHPDRVGSASDWAAVSGGDDYTLALKRDGTLWAWGGNGYGQLGLGDTTDRHTPTEVGSTGDWASVACGDCHTLALKRNGTLWAWGGNWYGQLGLGDTTERLIPTEVGAGSR